MYIYTCSIYILHSICSVSINLSSVSIVVIAGLIEIYRLIFFLFPPSCDDASLQCPFAVRSTHARSSNIYTLSWVYVYRKIELHYAKLYSLIFFLFFFSISYFSRCIIHYSWRIFCWMFCNTLAPLQIVYWGIYRTSKYLTFFFFFLSFLVHIPFFFFYFLWMYKHNIEFASSLFIFLTVERIFTWVKLTKSWKNYTNNEF